jgi:hypothetical protein
VAQPGVFRWKISASLIRQEGILRDLAESAEPEHRRAALEKMAKLIRVEAARLVPRETGELENELTVIYEGDLPTEVGVPASSPAIAKARATEYGSWNYTVGDPAGPKTEWAARSKPTAAMPWLRTGALVARPRILRWIRRYFLTGKRGRNDEP